MSECCSSGCGCGGGRSGGVGGLSLGPEPAWQTGWVETAAGSVPQVSTELCIADTIGTVRVRWFGWSRNDYRVEPGLYAVGQPTPRSPVLVTANYKLTFDRLRQELGGLDAWLLVLDTDGVNVWCAAGKGTFGTDELVRRLEVTRLAEVVEHRELILPQLGAPGVAAHTVKERSGFRVTYGPVYARDLPAFLAAGQRATPEMRRVRFGVWERLALAPIELTGWLKWLAGLVLLLAAICALGPGDWAMAGRCALGTAAACAIAYVVGCVLTPLLLPWLPGRAFTPKGVWIGLAVAGGLHGSGFLADACGVRNPVGLAAWYVLVPVVTGFLALNFTGATTFTSPSGVRRELRWAGPVLAAGLVLGVCLWVAAQLATG